MGLKAVTVKSQAENTEGFEEEVITGAENTEEVATGTKTRKSSAPVKEIQKLKDMGAEIFDSMTAEQQEAVGKNKDAVTLVRGLAGKRFGTTRTTVNGQKSDNEPIVFGFELQMNADTKVELFSDPKKGKREVVVKKGQNVQLTQEEAANLIGRPEFGGFFSNAQIFVRGTSKGYTGTLKLNEGSLRPDRIVQIDELVDGTFECLPEYKETFGFLYEKVASQRPGSAKSSVDSERNIQNTALGFAAYLRQKKNLG